MSACEEIYDGLEGYYSDLVEQCEALVDNLRQNTYDHEYWTGKTETRIDVDLELEMLIDNIEELIEDISSK